MNWMNVLCYLLGLAMGIEIAYLVMKYRYDTVAENIRSMSEKTRELINTNNRIIDKWSESVELNRKIIELNNELLKEIEEKY